MIPTSVKKHVLLRRDYYSQHEGNDTGVAKDQFNK